MRAVSQDNLDMRDEYAADRDDEMGRTDQERTEQIDEYMQSHAEMQQRARYGGFNFGAAFYGWLVATAVGVLLTALLAALGGAIALTQANNVSQLTNNAATVGLMGALALLVTSAVAYLAGGYVAGRLSRFDGGRQGLGVWLMSLIAAVVLGIAGATLGANFNLLQGLNLPSVPVDGRSFTNGGLATMLGILIITALAAVSGGRIGQNYHRKVDAAAHLEDRDMPQALQGQRLAHHH